MLNALSAIVILVHDPHARSLPKGTRRWLWVSAIAIIGILGTGVFMPLRDFDIELMAAGIVNRAKREGRSTVILGVNETFYQRAIIAEHEIMYDAVGMPPSQRVKKTLYINGRFQADTYRSPMYLPELSERFGMSVWEDPRVSLHIGDGRRFLRRSKDLYDVIVCDLPGPLEENTSMFYSYEFFRLVRSRLRPDGIFWMESESPRSIDVPYIVAHTVAAVFGGESTRLVRPSVQSHEVFSVGEIVVVASMKPDGLNRHVRDLAEIYANLRPQALWIDPEKHVQWLKEGKFQHRWKDYDVSTDDKPTILHIPPSQLIVTVNPS